MNTILFIYLIVTALLSGFLFTVWSKNGWQNIFFKFTFFCTAIVGLLLALDIGGYIILVKG